MTDKKKKLPVIIGGLIVCAALVLGILLRFGGNAEVPAAAGGNPPPNIEQTPTVNIQTDIPGEDGDKPVGIQKPDRKSDPGAGAESSGQEQQIQADPVKPDAMSAPEKPENVTKLPENHTADDVPESERRTEDEAPPEYTDTPKTDTGSKEPAAGSKNSAGEVYVPGFGYVKDSGPNEGGTLDDMYENGNKIGIMGGE